jgi:CRP-like cAMP-binding protein
MLTLGVVATLLCFRLQVDNNPQLFFKPGSPLLEQVDVLRASMAGAWTLFITVDTDEPGAFKKPENLARVEEFTHFMETQGWFDKTVTLTDYIKLLHREMNGGDDAFYAIPPRAESIEEYLLFLHRNDIKKFISPEFDDLNILVRHNVPSSHEMLEILTVLEAKAKEIFPPDLRVDFTGTTVLVNRSAHAIARGQMQGIAFVTVMIFLIMSLLFMQVKAGLLSLLPNLLPVAVLFGAMVAFGIPLDVGTAMIAAIAIGIAVDDTIHLMAHYQAEMRELQDQDAAMEATMRSEVQPVISTSVALALGFGVLAVSEFMPIVNFGTLSALVMVVAVLADLFMTPILLSSTQLITLWDMISLRIQKEALARSQAFAGLRATQIKTIVLLGRLVERGPGEAVVRAGEPGKSLLVVLDGTARVSVRDADAPRDFEVARLGPGDVFGEMALVEPGPRTATVVAVEALRCLEIDWEGLERIRRFYPRIAGKLFLNLARVLGGRLKATDRMLMQARGALQLQVARRRGA